MLYLAALARTQPITGRNSSSHDSFHDWYSDVQEDESMLITCSCNTSTSLIKTVVSSVICMLSVTKFWVIAVNLIVLNIWNWCRYPRWSCIQKWSSVRIRVLETLTYAFIDFSKLSYMDKTNWTQINKQTNKSRISTSLAWKWNKR